MMRFVIITVAMVFTASVAMADEWRRFIDPEFGYSIDLPDDGFDVEADTTKNGLTLYERDGRAQIDVYAFKNEEGLRLEQVRDALFRRRQDKRDYLQRIRRVLVRYLGVLQAA